MADYYSIIAKAVEALDPNTGEARRRIYERARGALSGETRSAGLPLDKSEILAAQMSLEEAIARVETEALRAGETRAAAESAPRPVAPLSKNGRGSLSRLWAQMFRSRETARAEPRIAEPRIAAPHTTEPRVAGSRFTEVRPAGPPPHPKGRDTWLTDLLARASREEDEGEDEAIAPPPPRIRRIQ
jgi:hypothetical protein